MCDSDSLACGWQLVMRLHMQISCGQHPLPDSPGGKTKTNGLSYKTATDKFHFTNAGSDAKGLI